MNHRSQSNRPLPASPWPSAVGLLAAAATTLIGVAAGHEPETILMRSLVSGAMTYVVAKLVQTVWLSTVQEH